VLFENSTDELVEAIEDTIRTNFEVQLPYINIADLMVARSQTNPNQINITLSINLIGNEFDTRQIDVVLDNQEQ
jgi:hypothetical protein